MVVPSCAVTTVLMAFGPTFNAIGPEAVPDVTAVPLTVMVALALVAVGVTVIEASPLPTPAV